MRASTFGSFGRIRVLLTAFWLVAATALAPLAAQPARAAGVGTVMGWGSVALAIPEGTTGITALAGGYAFALGLKDDGTVVAWGDDRFGETQVPAGLNDVIAVAAGENHSVALKRDGTVVAWGYNADGQINVPAGLSDVVAIAAGGYHTLALKRDGTVRGWGKNGSGQATPPATLSHVVAITAGGSHSVALKDDGTVVAWGGENDRSQRNVPAGLADVTAIAATGWATLALKRDGTVAAWGWDQDGVLNVPAGLNNVAAIAGGQFHGIALKGDGTVVTWGSNFFGERNLNAGLRNVTVIAQAHHSTLVVGEIVDITAPAASPTQSAYGLLTEWINSDVTVSWNWGDERYGAGVDPARCTTTSDTSGEGIITLNASCTDLAGNTGTASFMLSIDKTPPVLTLAATTADGQPYTAGTWTNQDVTVTSSCSDALSGLADTFFCDLSNTFGEGRAAMSASTLDNAGNFSAARIRPILIDKTAPSASATLARQPDFNGWYNAPLGISFSGAEIVDGSGDVTCTADQTYAGPDGAAASITGSCRDAAGNASAATASFQYDGTPPTLAPVVSPSPVVLNGSASASPNAGDATSGLGSSSCGPVDTSSVGSKSVVCTATDQAGNNASASASYRVSYNFSGFSAPVDNPPMINSAKAGKNIALKWRLLDANGTPVTNLSSMVVSSVAGGCSAGAPVDTLDVYATSASGLQNLGDGFYQFNWSTQKSWAGTCRTLKLDLGEGTGQERIALFQFR